MINTHVDADPGAIEAAKADIEALKRSLDDWVSRLFDIGGNLLESWKGTSASAFEERNRETASHYDNLSEKCQEYITVLAEFRHEIDEVKKGFEKMRAEALTRNFLVTGEEIELRPEPTFAIPQMPIFREFVRAHDLLRSREAQAHNSFQVKSESIASPSFLEGLKASLGVPSWYGNSSAGRWLDHFKTSNMIFGFFGDFQTLLGALSNVEELKDFSKKYGDGMTGLSFLSALGDGYGAFKDQWNRDSYDPTLSFPEKVVRADLKGGYDATFSFAGPYLGATLGTAAGAAVSGGTAAAAGGFFGGQAGTAVADWGKRQLNVPFSEFVDKQVRMAPKWLKDLNG